MSLKKLLSTFAAAALAFGLVNPTKAQSKPADARLSGVIVDDAESVPITRAHIWIHGSSGGANFEARPDRAGAFSIEIPNGYYFVLIGAPGFAPICKSIWVHDGKPIVLSPRLLPDQENQQDMPGI